MSIRRTLIRPKLAAPALLFSMLAAVPSCFGSDLVYIHTNRATSDDRAEMQLAADFYGLDLRVVMAGSAAGIHAIKTAVESKQVVGVVIGADALPVVNEAELLDAMKRSAGSGIPLLVLGVGPDVNSSLLKAWSGGAASGSIRIENSSSSDYVFSRIDGLTGQLGGLDVPAPDESPAYFAADGGGRIQAIEGVREGNKVLPVFIESVIGRQLVFLAGERSLETEPPTGRDAVSIFLRNAPAIMFVKYCAGERGWHSLHYYANFTIDDPWLREPYGYVDYERLLEEMEKHNFHTTIAFIPWNYNHSEPAMVSLIKENPNRFSISIHGNDHDHKEFTDYRNKPLTEQIGDIKQALSRMERFNELTGIPYDKTMVFPHSIAPEGTLAALKTYNYLATVNSTNVPQNATDRERPLDALRPVTLSYGGFPSISRYSAEMQDPQEYVAINQFLGNPLFFYDHSDLFAKGIGAFDPVADEVNSREPATEWRGLGYIVRHLYVVRRRDEASFDVRAFSGNISLENPDRQSATFYIQKQEIGGQTIASVTLDGKGYPYTFQDGQISFVVEVPPGGTRDLAIQYANDLQLAAVNPAHDSFVVDLLRMGSDFRDIYFARSGVGLASIRFYNEHELKPIPVLLCLLFILIAMSYVAYRLGGFLNRRTRSRQSDPHRLTH